MTEPLATHTQLFEPVGGYAFVAGVGAVLLLLLILGPARDRLPGRRRAVLVLLRLAVIALVLLAMLRPARLVPRIDKRPDVLPILVDRSRSMLTDDLENGKTRWQGAEELLAAARPVLDEVRDDLQVKLYGFDADAHLQPIEPDGELKFADPPSGNETSIGTSLDEALRPEAGRRLAGVFLITDGAQRTLAGNALLPEIPVKRWLADRGFPLFTVPLGKERAAGQARDVELRNLATSEPVFVKNPLTIEGTAVVEGFDNQPIEVQLLVESAPGSGKMEPVETVRLSGKRGATAGDLGERLQMTYVPTVPGEYRVALRAPVQPGELKTTNNEITTFVTVLAEGLSVLYVEGTARVEQTFVRRSLDASPDIRVDYLELNAQRPEARPVDLAKRFQPGAYDVYLLGDVDATAFSTEDLTALATAVRNGAGLVMLGGLHSFGAGGYGTTPLAELLPIQIDRLERQNFGEAVRTDMHWPGPLKMAPTKVGRTLPLMQLASGDAANDAAWQALPPLEGANRFAGLKEGALVLAASAGTDAPQPLIVARDFNRGRVTALAVDSTWRWRMRGFDAAHRRFWRRLILWSAHKEDQSGENVWIRLTQRTFSPGAKVEFTLGAQTPEGAPIADAVFAPTVTGPDGVKSRASVRRRGDDWWGEFTLPGGPAGDYLLEVTADDAAKKPLGRAQARLHVFGQDLELDNPNAYPGALKSLAEMTDGGRAITPAEFADVVRELRARSIEKRAETPELESLWDRWEFLALFVALLVAEWFLRKRWGLV
jgi:uncharacterized membrane protein